MRNRFCQTAYCKITTIVLFAFSILVTDFSFGQTAYIKVPGRRIIPNVLPYAYEDVIIWVECPQHKTHSDTSNLTFPVTGREFLGMQFLTEPDLGDELTLSATDVMMYFNKIYVSQGGYYIIDSTPSFARNCYGYATEKTRYFTRFGFDSTLNDEYNHCTLGADLGGTVVLEYLPHALKADTSKKKVMGEWEYRIVKTQEKNGPSGIYGKDINVPDGMLFEEDESVSLKVSRDTDIVQGFWKKKK